MPNTRFLLAGIALAVGVIAALLWLGAMQPAYSHFTPNTHAACGEPVALRAEGYNLLGGTRYGTGPDDPGDDVTLALVDLCDPVVQRLPTGEERLWFWVEVAAVDQTFPYYAWGIPEEDIHNPNANEWRDPVDPLWNYTAFTITPYVVNDGYWATGRGELCPLEDMAQTGLALFIDSAYDFRIPPGRTRAGWVCVRMGYAEPLPDAVQISIRPQLARVTRWVDRVFIITDTSQTPTPNNDHPLALPLLYSDYDVCEFALTSHPETVLSDRGCIRIIE